MEQKKPQVVESVDRALTLLTLMVERGELSVSDASRELGVAPSTAHRLLVTLCHRGYAAQGPRRVYIPGPEMGKNRQSLMTNRLIRGLRPLLERLFDLVGETVHLMVPVGADVRFVDGVEGGQPLRIGLRIGSQLPAYCVSGGKSILAQLDWAEVEAIHPAGLRRWPGATLHTMAELRAHLAAVRRRGYGLNSEESEPGVTALGAAVSAAGRPVGAISIAMPSVRFDPHRVDELGRRLLEAATAAGRVLDTT